MYSIFADGVCVYSDVFAVENMKVINPKLTLEDNAAGSLSVTLPPSNIGYETITRLVTDISVMKDKKELWAGRVLSESKDFYNNRILYCEGELAFFNDTTQPPAEYPGSTIRHFLETLISIHNSKVEKNRRFTIGAVSVHDGDFPTFYTNYEKTMEILNDLVETYGGHMRVRKENGIRYLDYLAEYPDTCTQAIQFGKNLIDFTRNWDSIEYATVIVPLGNRLDTSPIEALDAYLTVESVNGGSRFVQSAAAVATYGWIEKTVTWDDVTDPSVLLTKAKEYLEDLQFDNMVLELNALDLHYLSVDYEAVKLLDEIQVISLPHGLNRIFPVTKMEIPLDSPEKTQFNLGDTVQTSLTSVNNQTNSDILHRIEKLPKAHSILQEAKDNATAIMNMATTGFITITRDEYGSDTLYISNVRDYTKADKLWKWNMNGLGYSMDGGKTFGLAMTMDGAIVADYVTTGTMSADRIRTGILEATNKNVVFNLDKGTLVMKKGSIQLGQYSANKDGKGYYQFEVDDTGRLYAGSSAIFAGTLDAAEGTFGGQLVAATGNFKGIVQAEDFIDAKGNSMMNGGKFAAKYLDLYGLTVLNTRNGDITFAISDTGIITIKGKILMGPDSVIDWNSVDNENIYANPAYSMAQSANTLAQSAKEIADANKLPNYITSTKITQTTIESPTISGGTIKGVDINGAAFHNVYGNAWLELGNGQSKYGDLRLYSYNAGTGSKWEIFRVDDYSGMASMYLCENEFIYSTRNTSKVCALGTWDFNGATVTGLDVTAKFG